MSVPHGLHSTSLARLVRMKSATRFHALAMRRHDTKRNADSLLPSAHHWLRLLAFPDADLPMLQQPDRRSPGSRTRRLRACQVFDHAEPTECSQ
jgi:hypothetical protein